MNIEEFLLFLRNQNYFDIFLYIFFIYAIINGWKRGFLTHFFYFLTLLVGISFGFRYSKFVGSFIQDWLGSESQASEIIAGAIIFLGVATVSSVIASFVPNSFKSSPRDAGSRLAGVLSSFSWLNLFFCLFFSLINLLSLPNIIDQLYNESKLVNFYTNPSSFPQEALSVITGTDVLKSISRINELTGSSSYLEGCIEVPKSTPSQVAGRADLAELIASKINTHRIDSSLDYLETRQVLSDIAEEYAYKMYTEGFFCHKDPFNGDEAKDRLGKNNIRYTYIGENLIIAATTNSVHESVLRSVKHKETLEGSSYKFVGIGVVEGPLGLLVVQLFTG